jgi:micrococcal nuclease
MTFRSLPINPGTAVVRVRAWRAAAALVLLALALAMEPAFPRAASKHRETWGHAAAWGDAGVPAVVTAVVDGDTIRVSRDGRMQTVRLIGVDTPELHDREHPGAAPQPFAREAAEFARRTLAERHVRLEFDRGERLDHYGRLLAYVFLDDDTFFNRELVRLGYARAYTRYPFGFAKQFRAVQAEARAAQRGLWGLTGTVPAARGPIIGNRRSRLYHRPDQEHYHDVAEHNRVYFATEAEALDAGYEAARR